jgi:hypothetical protein
MHYILGFAGGIRAQQLFHGAIQPLVVTNRYTKTPPSPNTHPPTHTLAHGKRMKMHSLATETWAREYIPATDCQRATWQVDLPVGTLLRKARKTWQRNTIANCSGHVSNLQFNRTSAAPLSELIIASRCGNVRSLCRQGCIHCVIAQTYACIESDAGRHRRGIRILTTANKQLKEIRNTARFVGAWAAHQSQTERACGRFGAY